MSNYIVHSKEDRDKILKFLGIQSIEELFKFIPKEVLKTKIEISDNLSEKQIKDKLTSIAKLNKPLNSFSSFLGGGAYNNYIPSVVDYVTSISQFYTAYTPYQAEISQGTLQYIFEFQSLMCRLTGMDVSNASMYDGGSSLAEAILFAKRINNKKKILIPKTVNPQYRQIIRTYITAVDVEIVEIDYQDGITNLTNLAKNIDSDTSSVVIQNPNFFGCFEEVFKIREILKKYPDCLYIIYTYPMSLALIKPPSEYGADVVVGDAQCFGNHLNLGGPYVGFFTTKEKYLRQMPGRIVGKTVDKSGNEAYVLTFQTREQHIRKSKATSNICSNHSLNALASVVYLTILGENGLKNTANLCIQKANYFKEQISALSKFEINFKSRVFNEIVITSDLDISKVLKILYKNRILGGIPIGKYYPELKNSILVSFTENNSKEDIDKYVSVLKSL